MQRMKVSEIPYERADAEKVCGVIDKAVEKINAAKSVDDVLEARELVNDALRDFYTESSLANARFTLNTKDEFYSAEKENAELKEELEYYKNRKMSGRQKHNAKWMAIYNDFVVGYENGMTMVEIAKRNHVSERTIYRYKAYYEKMREEKKDEE